MMITLNASLILASASPRRQELLRSAGLKFKIIPAHVNEDHLEGETPSKHVRRLSRDKAMAIARQYQHSWVLGADTIVVIDGMILGKPRNKTQAKNMLMKLSGREHTVFTGFSIINSGKSVCRTNVVQSAVRFKTIRRDEMNWYINCAEPYDKAGGYAVQGKGLLHQIHPRFLHQCHRTTALRSSGRIKKTEGYHVELKIMETSIADNIKAIRQRIAAAAVKCQREPDAIKLLAVTKTVSPARVGEAIAAGITAFGENYVQEAKEKITAIDRRVEWHMIGYLQTNKVKYVVNLFDYIHSVDRMELAREINKRAASAGRKMNILVEINISGESTKSGIPAVHAIELIKAISSLENLAVKGLMTMAPYSDNPENSRPYFSELKNLQKKIINEGIPGIEMAELSMGMTDDFEIAIEEGATIVRIGRAIFGERK